jgi:cytoskeletal protein RodZ
MKKHSLLLCITLFIIILSIIITFFVILTNKGNHNSDISKDKENVETQIKEDNNQNVDEKVDESTTNDVSNNNKKEDTSPKTETNKQTETNENKTTNNQQNSDTYSNDTPSVVVPTTPDPVIEEPKVDLNAIDTNDILYPSHHGNIQYSTQESCNNAGFEKNFADLEHISGFSCVPVYSIGRSILGYYLEIRYY